MKHIQKAHRRHHPVTVRPLVDDDRERILADRRTLSPVPLAEASIRDVVFSLLDEIEAELTTKTQAEVVAWLGRHKSMTIDQFRKALTAARLVRNPPRKASKPSPAPGRTPIRPQSDPRSAAPHPPLPRTSLIDGFDEPLFDTRRK